jgi:hypothetical protein
MKNSHIVILVVIIIAGVAWYYFDKKKKTLDANPTPTPNPRTPIGSGFAGGFIYADDFPSKSQSVIDSRVFTDAGNKGGRAIVNSNRVLVLS